MINDDRSAFRYSIGTLVLVGGLLGFAALIAFPIPAGNRDAVVLALGLVLGWGSTVVGYEFGSSSAGRKAAEVGLKAADAAPQAVTVTNTDANPVQVENAK